MEAFIDWVREKLGKMGEIELLERRYSKLVSKSLQGFSSGTDSKSVNGKESQYAYTPKNDVDNYTEEQYNDFGWASYSGLLTHSQINDLYSKIQAKRSLKSFPQSSKGEAIVAVNPHPESSLEVDNTLVFVKGTKQSFSITRVLVIDLYSETDIFELEEFIYEAEQKPWSRARGIVANMFESELVREFRHRDFASYQEYAAATKQRSLGREGATNNRNNKQQSGRANDIGESASDEITSYSYTPSKSEQVDELFEMYENGQISKEELKRRVVGKKSGDDPISLINRTPESMNATPELKRKEGENKDDRELNITKPRQGIFFLVGALLLFIPRSRLLRQRGLSYISL